MQFLDLPSNVIHKILSFLYLRTIFIRLARVNSKLYSITKQPAFIKSLKKLYFTNAGIEFSLSKAKKVELPFYGYYTDGHCPNPEQWIDQLFMRTSNSLVILQNCNNIKAILSQKNREFKNQIQKLIMLVKQYLPPNTYNKDRLYEVQIAKIYELSYSLSQVVFERQSQEERQNIRSCISYFWERVKANQLIIQQNTVQPIQANYKAIIKEFSLAIVVGYTKMPKILLISMKENESIEGKEVLRTNMSEFSAVAQKYIQDDQNPFGYCIFKQNQGVLALFDFKQTTQIKLKLLNDEIQIVDQLHVTILEHQILNQGYPGSAFQYIVASGYLLD